MTTINYILALAVREAAFTQQPFWRTLIIGLEYLFGTQESILQSFKTTGVLLQSVFLFLWLQFIRIPQITSLWRRFLHKILAFIARHSLDIYGWHMLFVHLIREWASMLQIRYAFPLIFLGAVPCSIAAGYAGNRLLCWFSRPRI